jgi:hypothetical protein
MGKPLIVDKKIKQKKIVEVEEKWLSNTNHT